MGVEGTMVLMSIRPEKIEISKSPLEGFSNHVTRHGAIDCVSWTFNTI